MSEWGENYQRRCRVSGVIDGDSLMIVISAGWHAEFAVGLRLSNVDTPELRPRRANFDTEELRQEHIAEARAAKAFTEQWVKDRQDGSTEGWPFVLVSHRLDPNAGGFGRSLGDLRDGVTFESLAESLIEAGHDTGRRW